MNTSCLITLMTHTRSLMKKTFNAHHVKREVSLSPGVTQVTPQRQKLNNMTSHHRSWCPVCVEAQGEKDPHYRVTKEDLNNEAPVVSMDDKELSEHESSKARVMMVVCRDKWTKSTAAHVAQAKGSTERAKRTVEFLGSFGYADIGT